MLVQVIRTGGDSGVIGKTQAARQPSVDDLLASIRQAIHERVAPGESRGQTGSPAIARIENDVRPAGGAATDPPVNAGSGRDGHRIKRTIVATGHESFAGLLGGDVRLEEALARLNQAGWRRGGEAAKAVAATADSGKAPVSSTKLRPTIDDWGGGASSARPALARPLPLRPVAAAVASAQADRAASQSNTGSLAAHKPQAPGKKDELWEEDPMSDDRRPATERSRDVSGGSRRNDLLSSESASAASSAFNRLAETMVSRVPAGRSALDEMTRECLRPLLKAWLDENLPGLVERLVREEIERVARPGR